MKTGHHYYALRIVKPPAEFRLDYETLSVLNPRLVYCSITGYGPDGPYAKRPGYDVIVSAVGGLLNITGPEGGEPVKPGVALVDMMTGTPAVSMH